MSLNYGVLLKVLFVKARHPGFSQKLPMIR